MNPKFLTIEELSLKLQVPKSWIYDRTRFKEIPFFKIGKYIRFKESEIENWLKNQSSLKNKTLVKRRP